MGCVGGQSAVEGQIDRGVCRAHRMVEFRFVVMRRSDVASSRVSVTLPYYGHGRTIA